MKKHKFIYVYDASPHLVQKLFDKATPFLDEGWKLVNGSVQYAKTGIGMAGVEHGTWLCLLEWESEKKIADFD